MWETSCSLTLSLTYLVTLIKRSPMLVLVCHIETLFTYQVLVVFVFLLFERCNLRIDSYASLWAMSCDVDDPWVVSIDLSAAKTRRYCARGLLWLKCNYCQLTAEIVSMWVL